MIGFLIKEWLKSMKIKKLTKERDSLLEILFSKKCNDEDSIRKRWVAIENEMRCLKSDAYAKEHKRIKKLNEKIKNGR